MTAADAEAIAGIYAPYVLGSIISFEAVPPDAAVIAERISSCGDLYPWIVAEDADGRLCGYAYSSPFRTRPAYRFTVETSVYLAPASHGRGIGTRLYRALLSTLEAQGFVQAIGAIALPNPGSVRLHESLGFVQSGLYRQVGYKFDAWHDVGLWQRDLRPALTPPEEPKSLSEQPLILL